MREPIGATTQSYEILSENAKLSFSKTGPPVAPEAAGLLAASASALAYQSVAAFCTSGSTADHCSLRWYAMRKCGVSGSE